MSQFIKLRPIHKYCNRPMNNEGLQGYEILICPKCNTRKLTSTLDFNNLRIIDNKLLIIE